MDPEPRAKGARRATPKPSIPGYEIEDEIGRGATGVVYRARQEAVDREVALKVLHRDLASKPRIVGRLQREARTTARLAHPHIVTAIDMGEVGGIWWYAMELVDGPSLALRLRQEGRLTERAALRLLIPIVEALRHAWEHGVVHRDIKPANILIDQSGVAYLGDLGLAFREEDPLLTKTGGTLGTPHYISPEQARDPATVDVRSDIWSFGATLFHTVCGRAPFSGESMAEVLSGVLYGRLADPRALEPALSPGLGLVLRKCLQRDLGQRYQTPHELWRDLDRVRERRQPKVSRFELEPVGEGQGTLRTYLIATAVVIFGVAGLWLALTRPWAGEIEFVDDDLAGPTEVDPLAFLRGEVIARADLDPSEALERLEELRDSTPSEQAPEWRELRDALRHRARGEVAVAKQVALQSYEAALVAGDLDAAERALGPDFDAALRERTGYRLAQLPTFLSSLEQWRKLQLNDLEKTRAREARAAEDLSTWFREALGPRIDRLEREGRWREAFEALELEDTELLDAARIARTDSGAGGAAAVRQGRPLLKRRHEQLMNSWGQLDASLTAWIEGRERALARELESGERHGGAPALLRADFQGELEDRGTRLSDLPVRPAPSSVEALEQGAERLALVADQLDRSEAEERFATLESVAAELWPRRDHAAIEELWRRFLADLSGLRSTRSGEWRDVLEERADMRIREADWLGGLLDEASRVLIGMNSEYLRLRGISQSIRGRVSAGFDPLTAGFHLVSEDGYRWYFHPRQMAWRDIEDKLLGWPHDSAEFVDPDNRLKRALARYHEGDFVGAHEALDSGPTPGDYQALTRNLRERLEDSERRDRLIDARRETAAQQLLNELDREPAGLTRSQLLVVVDGVLRQFDDVPGVLERRTELKGRLRELEDPPAPPAREDFLKVFGPDQLDLYEKGRVRMSFEFHGADVGAWRPGTWEIWRTPRGGGSWQALRERPGPALELGWPLDPRAGELIVDVEFEQPFDSGAPALFVLSVLGYDFALVGAGLPPDNAGRKLGAVATSQGLDNLINEIRSGRIDGSVSFLTRSRVHRVRLTLIPGRHLASMEVKLEGGQDWREVFDRKRLSRPLEVTDRVELRSWEPIVLRSAVIDVARF